PRPPRCASRRSPRSQVRPRRRGAPAPRLRPPAVPFPNEPRRRKPVKNTQRRMSRPSLGGMLATRQGALVLALVCAACAAGIQLFALGQYKSAQTTPQTVQATVLVATAEITKG